MGCPLGHVGCPPGPRPLRLQVGLSPRPPGLSPRHEELRWFPEQWSRCSALAIQCSPYLVPPPSPGPIRPSITANTVTVVRPVRGPGPGGAADPPRRGDSEDAANAVSSGPRTGYSHCRSYSIMGTLLRLCEVDLRSLPMKPHLITGPVTVKPWSDRPSRLTTRAWSKERGKPERQFRVWFGNPAEQCHGSRP